MKHVMRFLPLLLIYILIFALVDLPEGPRSDAARYLWFAENLTDGYFSPRDKINLWSGPGYPLILAPVVALNLPLIVARLLNIAFVFGAALYLFLTARRLVGFRAATAIAYVMGLWPQVLRTLPLILTEPLSVFLTCGFAYHFSRLHQTGTWRRRHFVIAAVYLGYLALTKVIFGYVILTALLILVVLYLVRRARALKRDVLVCCLALVLCLPYLVYTYSLTGKSFYWGTSGGMSLYWMSSPYEGDLGDWHTTRMALNKPELASNHAAFLSSLGGLESVEKDDALRAKAIENIRSNPAKYVRNWIANLGRLFLNYPRSHTSQRLYGLIDIGFGVVIVIAGAFCLWPTFVGRRRIPHETWILLLVAVTYLGGSSLLSAYNRFLLPALPILLLWMAAVFERTLRLEMLK